MGDTTKVHVKELSPELQVSNISLLQERKLSHSLCYPALWEGLSEMELLHSLPQGAATNRQLSSITNGV